MKEVNIFDDTELTMRAKAKIETCGEALNMEQLALYFGDRLPGYLGSRLKFPSMHLFLPIVMSLTLKFEREAFQDDIPHGIWWIQVQQ